MSAISSACSPVSGWETSSASVSTPSALAYSGSSACSASMNAAMPPAACALATACRATVVLPRGLRAVDLHDPAARQAADAERDVEGDRPGGDHADRRAGVVAEAHHRALAVLFSICARASCERLLAVGCGHLRVSSLVRRGVGTAFVSGGGPRRRRGHHRQFRGRVANLWMAATRCGQHRSRTRVRSRRPTRRSATPSGGRRVTGGRAARRRPRTPPSTPSRGSIPASSASLHGPAAELGEHVVARHRGGPGGAELAVHQLPELGRVAPRPR